MSKARKKAPLDRNKMAVRIEQLGLLIESVSKECQAHLNNFQGGLIAWQQKIGNLWNITNGYVRMIETLGIEQGWWKDREEYQERFAASIKEVMEETAQTIKDREEQTRSEKEKQDGTSEEDSQEEDNEEVDDQKGEEDSDNHQSVEAGGSGEEETGHVSNKERQDYGQVT